MGQKRTIVIGAGIAGLVAALLLAAKGVEVVLLEAADAPGGKIATRIVGGRPIDVGPTVFTMRGVFDAILEEVGASLDDHLTLRPANILARHAWDPEGQFDLPADRQAAIDAVADFFGGDEAARYAGFCASAKAIHDAVAATFITGEKPSRLSVPFRIGLNGAATLARHHAFGGLWRALCAHFTDPRLRQLFGRYATYCGSSPFLAPAMLMLVAHVEQDGVWLVDGGMIEIATMLARLATARGADIRYGASVSEILVDQGRASGVVLTSGDQMAADTIIFNGDVAALADGLLGRKATKAVTPVARADRSLSALTWALTGSANGFQPARHTVFFGADYAQEFDAIFRQGRLPQDPTVYVCAQDRDASGQLVDPNRASNERFFCLVNAPANGDSGTLTPEEIETCRRATFARMERCGLTLQIEPGSIEVSTPAIFHARFPGTGGALYGRANHKVDASFQRPGARSRIPGLYLAGGSLHPGPGVPMAALSGMQAAAALVADLVSTRPYRQTATAGGISTRSATTAVKL